MSEAPERVWVDVDDDYHGHGSMIGRVYSADLGDVEYIRADVSAARIADLERKLAEREAQVARLLEMQTEREVDHERQLAEAREEAAIAGGSAAVEMLLRQEPDASPLKVQLTRQAIAKAIRNMKGPRP